MGGRGPNSMTAPPNNIKVILIISGVARHIITCIWQKHVSEAAY